MKTKNQVLLIKVIYVLILLLYLTYNFSDLQRGFHDAANGVEPNEKFTFFSGTFLLISAAIGLAILTNLYLFINSIQANKIFTATNIKRISKLGWYCILQSFLLYAFYFSKSNLSNGFSYRSIISVNFEFWLLLFGLTLLTIGFVFKKGIELQQDHDLTI